MSLRGTAVTFLSTLFAVSYGYSSPMLMPLGIETNPAQMCPVPMPDFELSEFLGDWFIMEYEFASETKLTSLDCLGYKYTLNDVSNDIMVANFTFRFPPKSGNMFHVPTFAVFGNDSSAKWNTNFRNGEFLFWFAKNGALNSWLLPKLASFCKQMLLF